MIKMTLIPGRYVYRLTVVEFQNALSPSNAFTPYFGVVSMSVFLAEFLRVATLNQ